LLENKKICVKVKLSAFVIRLLPLVVFVTRSFVKMRAMKKLIAGMAFLGSLSMVQAGGISPWIQYWDTDFSGNISGRNAAGVRGSANIRESSDESFGFGAKLKILGLNSTLSYNQLKYNTLMDVNATVDINFDNKTIKAGDTVNLDYEWNTLDLGFRWGRLGVGKNKFQFLGGIQVVDASIKIHGGAVPGTQDVDLSETLPIPYIGATGSLNLSDKLNLESTLKMLDLSLDDNDVEYVDFEVGLEWKMRENGSLFLGYKSKDLDVKVNKGNADEAAFDTKKDGFLLGWRFKF
jgi:hypothetical protein